MDLPVGVEISALEVRQHPLPTVKQREVPSLRGFVLSVQRGEMMAKGVDSDRQRRNYMLLCSFVSTTDGQERPKQVQKRPGGRGGGSAELFMV